MSASEVVHGF